MKLFLTVLIFVVWLPRGDKGRNKGWGRTLALYFPWKSLLWERKGLATVGGGATTVVDCFFVSTLVIRSSSQ